MNLSSRRSKLIILISLFVVFAISGGYLLWRINQPETVAPDYTEATCPSGCFWHGGFNMCLDNIGCRPESDYPNNQCPSGRTKMQGFCCVLCTGAPSPTPNCGDRMPSDIGKAVNYRCENKVKDGKVYNYECGAWCYLQSNKQCCTSTPTPTQYTVTYNANGGSCTPSSRTISSGGNSAAPSCSRTGHSLTGFSRASGSGGSLNASTGAVSSVTGNQTIRANWDINKYTVTYSPGEGGSCEPSNREVEHGGDSSGPSCTRDGYELTSFSRTSGEGGTLDQETGAVTGVTGTQTITASWDALPDPGCGDRAGTYPHTTTDWPEENTEWCEIGEASEFDPNQEFPSPGESITWQCISGTTTANCSTRTEEIPEEIPEEEPVEEIVPDAPTVPETGIFDDSQNAVLLGLALLFLGFTWRILGRGMYMSVSFLGRVPKKISIYIKDVKEDIQAKKRIKLLKKKELNRKKFEQKVVKD